ncbi:fructosamine kinase family protein [Fulvivirga lutea]|uniref:Fructosamine kinase family protein n=1 Tax=Fulvivirga lutea TaxID=2810512 RepID=A0A974WEA9_9BACT|nr:fructosamine kinase family protein [Fulvivirga lutea]QSE96195.1 fructosamine kinase family protein [Fulvivirga lutea]
MIPEEIKTCLIDNYGELQSFTPASGGCINNGGTAKCKSQELFLKWNSASLYPGMFAAEAKGLNLLRKSELIVPEVLEVINGQTYEALILENIRSGGQNKNTMEKFGGQLAQMHRITQKKYGLDHDNYMGSLKQYNKPHENWIEFYIAQRLEPQLEIAVKKGLADLQLQMKFEKLYKLLPKLLVIEQPSLVHGDLWSGNYMINSDGNAVLIDPAVTFANREVDLAMTKLFGGFSQEFYSGYEAEYPTEKGLNERLDIYNLYPLLIHLNLFGSSYRSQIISILNYFI